MSYRERIIERCLDRATLIALTDDRIYWDFADNLDAPATPAVVFFDISATPRIDLSGGTQLEHRFQAMVLAATPDSAQAVFNELYAEMHNLRDLANGISYCRLLNLTSQHDAASNSFTWNADFKLITT